MGTPPPIKTANLGMADTLILMVLALVVFGPRRLPQIGRQIGKLMYEFRKASNDFKFQMEEELRAVRRGRPPQEGRGGATEGPGRGTSRTATGRCPRPQQVRPQQSTAESAESAPSSYAGSTHRKSLFWRNERSDVAAEGTGQKESTEDLTASAVEAAAPRIQPPHRREVVAANPPGRGPAASRALRIKRGTGRGPRRAPAGRRRRNRRGGHHS